ncbi:TauD/TfdA family dioxygenase [Streptomyces sp. NPDC046332]|uniref:TauD/TfdA family dioxygenase n=1 Tax=Streptomyces sp. NPDC046332 TaxID=3155133 RepID=UPI0033D6A063
MTTPPQGTAVPELSGREAAPDVLLDGLEQAGALLIRNAGVDGADALADLAAGLGLAALDQPEPFALRRPLGRGVWSQPAWPATSPMCMHHELGWQRQPPPYLLVACLHPASSGGATGVADGRTVLSLLPENMTERAGEHGWSLVRRYTTGLLGMPWQDAFPGLDAAGVEAYAADEETELEWSPGGLTTRRTRPAIRPTGRDGTPAWSNLLAFCSEWTMDPAVRAYLVTALGREGLPFETGYGDGAPFTAEDVATVNSAYERVTTRIDWRAGDVLLLDNLRTAHSMEPSSDDRRTAVLHAGPAAATHS